MHSLLIWVLINTATAQPVPPYQFTTQADCMRAISTLNAYGKHPLPYDCKQWRVADPYVYTAPPQSPVNPAVTARAQRNAAFWQNHINTILSNPPAPVHP